MKYLFTVLLLLFFTGLKSQKIDSSNYYIIVDSLDLPIYDSAKNGVNRINCVRDNIGDWVVPYAEKFLFPILFDWVMIDDIVPLGYDDFPHNPLGLNFR